MVKADTVSEQQWGFWDFMATAVCERVISHHRHSTDIYMQADIAGVSQGNLPRNDGYSLVPTLQGETQDQPKSVPLF